MVDTTSTWLGGKTDTWNQDVDWRQATNWQGVIPDSPTAAVLVNDGSEPALINGGTITVDTLEIGGVGTLGGQVVVGGSKQIFGDTTGGDGGTLIAEGSIDITSTNPLGGMVGGSDGVVKAPMMDIGPNVIIGGGGTYDVTNLINQGLIQADGGRTDLGLGPVVVTGGTVTGTGSFELDAGSTLEIGSVMSQDIAVNAPVNDPATLIIDDPKTFGGTIGIVNPNTKLEVLLNGVTPKSATFDATKSSLVVTDASGATTDIAFHSPDTASISVTAGGISITDTGTGTVTPTTPPIASTLNPPPMTFLSPPTNDPIAVGTVVAGGMPAMNVMASEVAPVSSGGSSSMADSSPPIGFALSPDQGDAPLGVVIAGHH